MDKPIGVPGRLLMAIATLQGGCLLGLYRIYEHSVWPSDQPVFGVPLWQFFIMFPLLVLLSLSNDNRLRVVWFSAAFTGFSLLFAAYIGWQLSPDGMFSQNSLMFTYCLTMTIVTFKAAMYLQAYAHQGAFSYQSLFTQSWRNFLVMGLALLFVLVVGLLLLLWAQLFKVIGIDFFTYLFRQDWFLFPVIGFAFGVGITIFRDLGSVIDSITSLLQGLIRLLLPALMVVSLLFLLSLAVVGVDTLWDTGFGSTLLLWLIAILLFFVNAVYQDGRGDPIYSPGVHRLIAVGVLTLPVLSALSSYGLFTRIGQYGLTVERIYGLLVWLTLLMFSLGYVWGVLRQRDRWTQTLGQVNVVMGLVMVALLLALSSPFADPRKLSVASQLGRLEQGHVTLATLDVRYFRQHLARPGHLAYEELAAKYGEEYPAIVRRWKHLQHHPAVPQQNGSVWDRIALRPANLELPDGVVRQIEQAHPSFYQGDGVLMPADLNRDGRPEYLLVGMHGGYWGFARFFYFDEGVWKTGMLDVVANAAQPSTDLSIFEDEIQIEAPRYLNVRLGDVLLVPQLQDQSAVMVFQSPDRLMKPAGRTVKPEP